MLVLNPAPAKFIKEVLGYIRYQKVHSSIAYELEDHIECLKEAYIGEGLTEKEAYEKAILQMGKAENIGTAFNKMYKPKMEWSILVALIAVISIGLFALYCADQYLIPYVVSESFMKQLIYGVIGLIVLIAAYFFDYRYFDKWAVIGYLVGVGILIYGETYGVYVNGVTRWIKIGPIHLTTAQLVVPLLMISYIGIIRKFGNDQVKNYIGLGVIAIVPIFILMKSSFVSAGLLGFCLITVLTLYISSKEFKGDKVKLLPLLYSSIIGGGGLLGFLIMRNQTYYMERLKFWLYPELDPMGSGYQPLQMQIIRENASLIGSGGFNAHPIESLPEPIYDTVLTFIVGSMGWLAGVLLILIIGFMIIRMFSAAMKVQESYGRLVTLSIAAMFTMQFVYNIAMNLGYVPLTGMPLPFVSYGGSNLVINAAMMGIFLSVYRRKDLVLREEF